MERQKSLALLGRICLFGLITMVVMVPRFAPAAEKAIELKFADFLVESTWGPQKAFLPWQRSVEAATNNRVKITHYGAQTLCKGFDAWEATKTGIADIAFAVHGYWGGKFPVSDVMALPVPPISTSRAASGIMWQLFQKFPEVADEYKEVKVLTFLLAGPYTLYTTDKVGELRTVKDFAGKKIRSLAGPGTDFFKAMNANCVLMPTGDVTSALQKGILDAVLLPRECIQTFKLGEMCKYMNYLPFFYGHMSIVMNLSKWNSLPPDIQEAIMSVSGLAGSELMGKRFYDDSYEGLVVPEMDRLAKTGRKIVIYTPTENELNGLSEVAKPIWQGWLGKMKARGVNGQAILDEITEIAKTYQ